MSLFDTLREHRVVARARRLAEQGELDDALDALRDTHGEDADTLRGDLRREAARLWLSRATEAAEADDGERLRRHMARARRYHMPEIDAWYRHVDRLARRRQVQLTNPEPWVQLVEEAAEQQARWSVIEEPTLSSLPAWGLFARRELLKEVARAWSLSQELPGSEALERADAHALREVLPLVRAGYSDDLGEAVDSLGPEFVRAVLLLSCGRPDLAALPLVELPESEPLVCFERARVAHTLGMPRIALLALQGFAQRAGGHHRIRRLHTAVFAAQMALTCGERDHALELLRAAPIQLIGGRPLVLMARLLADAGEPDQACELLRQNLMRDPEHASAAELLRELEAIEPSSPRARRHPTP